MTAKAKVHVKAKHTSHAKAAAAPSSSKVAKTHSKASKWSTSKSHSKKHSSSGGTSKKSLAVGDWLPVCAFEAVAMSLRLAGQPVHGDDVAQLWHLAGADPDGASIADALAAAARFGLAGYRPLSFGDHRFGLLDGRLGDGHRADSLLDCQLRVGTHGPLQAVQDRGSGAGDHVHALILGIDRPGPHAVLATRDGWWSWGELHDPWPCRIDSAWAVSWS